MVVVALLSLVAGLWAWSQGASTPEAAPASSSPTGPVSQVAVPAASTSTPVASSALPSSEDSMSSAEQREVVAFASRFAAAFSRPAGRTDYRAWWRMVAAMMTDDAASDFVGTDPSEVPYTKVTGPITLLAGGDAEAYWLQRVQVPTDAGVFVLQVQLVTPGLSDRLLVSGVEFP